MATHTALELQPTAPPNTLTWRRLLAVTAGVNAAGYVLYAATIHEFPPAGYGYGLLLALAAWWVVRTGSRPAIATAGVLHAFELFNVLFVYDNIGMIANPSAWQDFLVGVFFIVANATGTVAALGAWRHRERG